MAAAAPSTAPANPLEESLEKIVGKGTLPRQSDLLGYDPNQSFRAPQADVINISGSPGTGASVPETWSHEISLENLKQQQLEFEYQQQQEAIANTLRQQEAARAQAESQRAAEQLGLTKQTTAGSLAAQQLGMEQTRQGMQYATTGEQRAATKAALDYAAAQQAMAIQAATEQRAKDEYYFKYGGMTPAQVEAGKRASAAAMGPAYYVPGNTGLTYYKAADKPAANAILAPSGASGYDPATHQWAYPSSQPAPLPATGPQGYYDRTTGQWAYR